MDHLIPVGLPKRGINVTVCEVGYAKIQDAAAKLDPVKAEGKVNGRPSWNDSLEVRKKPYIRARFLDDNAKVVRPELGRWLLGSTLPVAHINGNPLDFRICNLEARETDKQRKRREGAATKRTKREEKKAELAAKRANRPPVEPDGLTTDEQFAVMFDAEFHKKLTRMAGAIIRDPMEKGTVERPTDARRADEVVSAVIEGSIGRVKTGMVRNIKAFLWSAVRTQAQKERARRWYAFGHVRRPRAESHNLSELEAQEEARMENEY
jgi:hypothetical protein